MQRYYNKRAREYDASMGYGDPAVVESLVPVIDEIKNRVRGLNVLELACGPGFWTSHMIETAKFVLASDYNQSTLDQAINRNLPSSKVRFIQTDAYDIKSVQGEFEVLVAVDWLAHVPLAKMQVFLQNVNHRLPADSQMIFVDQLPGPHSLTSEFDQQGNHIQTRALENGEVFKVIKHFFSDQQYMELFKPYLSHLSIQRFETCRRVLVSGRTTEHPVTSIVG